jgi:hypothetical protein
MHASPIVFDICVFLFPLNILLGGFKEVGVGSFRSTSVSAVVDVKIVF